MTEKTELIPILTFAKNVNNYIGKTIVVDCSEIIEDRFHTIGMHNTGFAAEYEMVENSRYVLLFDREPDDKFVEISIFDRKLNKLYGVIAKISYVDNFEDNKLSVTYFTFVYNG